jgi:hypothetical protein
MLLRNYSQGVTSQNIILFTITKHVIFLCVSTQALAASYIFHSCMQTLSSKHAVMTTQIAKVNNNRRMGAIPIEEHNSTVPR